MGMVHPKPRQIDLAVGFLPDRLTEPNQSIMDWFGCQDRERVLRG